MELEAILAISMFATAIIALLAGFPVALTLGGVALVFALIAVQLGFISPLYLQALPKRISGAIMGNQILIAVPLFVLMGVVLERSRVAEDLLAIASRLLGHIRGGLGYAVVLVGAMLAASTGIVGATVTTMTLIALPTMLRQGYDPKVATGTIAASGTLGQIIPPSIVLILLADAISNAVQSSTVASGANPVVVSVGDLFAGALLPGVVLVGIYLIYLFLMATFRPDTAPPLARDEAEMPSAKEIIFGLGAPLALIVIVLGSILFGVASPTEASAIGAAGAILLAGLRLSEEADSPFASKVIMAGLISIAGLFLLAQFVDLRAGGEASAGRTMFSAFALLLSVLFFAGLIAGSLVLWKTNRFKPAMASATYISSMVFLILIGASLFSLVFRAYGGDELISELLSAMPGGVWGALALTMLVMFVLGFFLDFIEIIFVVVPLVTPPLLDLGVDPIWLAILMAVNLQTSFLTPPFGFALFYLRGAAPKSVRTLDIWKGALPFIGLQLILIALIALFPAMATWLPDVFLQMSRGG